MSQAGNKDEEPPCAAKYGSKCSEKVQVKYETPPGGEVRHEKTLNQVALLVMHSHIQCESRDDISLSLSRLPSTFRPAAA